MGESNDKGIKMRVTKKSITDAIKKKYDVDVEMDKCEGIYYWCGDCTMLFDGSCTHMNRLSDWSVERWVEDFGSYVEDAMETYGDDCKTFREAVDKFIENMNNYKPIVIKLRGRG
jgi:hypothetical protein